MWRQFIKINICLLLSNFPTNTINKQSLLSYWSYVIYNRLLPVFFIIYVTINFKSIAHVWAQVVSEIFRIIMH